MGARGGVLWETCAVDGCLGARLGAEGHCLQHCSDEALAELLAKGSAPVELDGRGVTFDKGSLTRLLDAIPVQDDRRRWLGSARFDGATFLHEVTFDETTFAGPASFAGVTFAADARFGGATFGGEVSFEGATFEKQAWFVGAAFRSAASFAGATFGWPAWFQRTVFDASARFDRAAFSQNVTFNAAAFSSVSSFTETEFQSLAVFDKATFGAASSWDGARFAAEGQGRPSAVVPSAAAMAPPIFDGPLFETMAKGSGPAQPAGARRWRPDTSNVSNLLVPLLAVAVVVAAGFIILRPSSGRQATSEQIESTTTLDPRDPMNPAATPSTLLALGNAEAFTFEFVGPTGRPARFNPCAPLRYVVNPAGAPDNWQEVLREAVGEVSRATGLTLEEVGRTDETALIMDSTKATAPGGYEKQIRRSPFQPDRYPGGWAPILIFWSDLTPGPGATGGFELNGIGGSERRSTTDGSPVYVTGVIVVATSLDPKLLKPVLMHEFGHVLGLDHTDDRLQVMAATHNSTVPAWGAGDLTGLSKVGAGSGCLPVPLPSPAAQAPTVITTPVVAP